jgi:hypothetical protein
MKGCGGERICGVTYTYTHAKAEAGSSYSIEITVPDEY